jgi:hypothetical protein
VQHTNHCVISVMFYPYSHAVQFISNGSAKFYISVLEPLCVRMHGGGGGGNVF